MTEWRERKGCDKWIRGQIAAFSLLFGTPFGAAFADRNVGMPINLVTLERSRKDI